MAKKKPAQRDPQLKIAGASQIFLAHEHQVQIPASDLAVVNAALAEALAAGQLTPNEAGLKWGWKHEGTDLAQR